MIAIALLLLCAPADAAWWRFEREAKSKPATARMDQLPAEASLELPPAEAEIPAPLMELPRLSVAPAEVRKEAGDLARNVAAPGFDSKLFDGTREVEGAMPFPDLAAMIAESQGVKKPPRAPLPPLPSFPDAPFLPREVLVTILMKMANFQNWSDVAYGASGHRNAMDKVRAEWAKRDSRDDVNEYMAKLNAEQRRLADAAFKGGMAEIPDFHRSVPETVDLAWVKARYPAKQRR